MLDAFEERLDLPTSLIDVRNRQGRERCIVGYELKFAVGFFVIEGDQPDF